MRVNFIILVAFFGLTILIPANAYIRGCPFYETADISSSIRLPNGSYLFRDLEVPSYLTGYYGFITTEDDHTEEVKRHLRGCVCQLRLCIWICCRHKDMQSNGECTDGLMKELAEINPFLNVTLRNGSVVKRNVLKDFIVLRDRLRWGDVWEEDTFTLFENGTVLLKRYANETIWARGYDCLHPNQFRSDYTETFVAAFHTHISNGERIFSRPEPYGLVYLSQVLLALTIAVYIYVKKLRNLHGKCFICYMVFTSLHFLYLELDNVEIPLQLCVLYAYSYHFFSTAQFTWLLSLSHQMWKGFTSVNRAESEYSFWTYSIFAWATPAILTGLVYLMDLFWYDKPSKVNWIPGAGFQSCYIIANHSLYVSITIPVFLLLALNTTLFTLTSARITKVKLSLKHFSDQDVRAMNLIPRIQTLKVFLRLLIVMDLQWSVRFISHWLEWELLSNICMYCDYSFGIIIFVLFILKRRTIRLLMESIQNRRN